jgi:predicted Ser/Thr protein kinase/Tfp pilus assembly protein PilF
VNEIGRYRVIRQLGHGGMGEVYLAHDPSLERDVAIKLLHPDAAQTTLRDEAKALAALNHPGIVTIFEIGEHDGRDFIAMEHVDGRSLRQLMQSKRATRDGLLRVCAHVAAAVDAAHRAGILHRDIKPENVIVSDSGAVKVVDFGIARRLDDARGRTSRPATARELVDMFTKTMPVPTTDVSQGTQTMFGTPAYMAPEILTGEASSKASDTYSLGIVIYECLAHHRPYDAVGLAEMIAQTIDGTPPRLDDPLADTVAAMLAREPAKRPALVDVAAAISKPEAPVVPRRRWPTIAIAAGISLGALAVAWAMVIRPDHDAPPPPPPPPTATASVAVAIAPLAIAIPSYGSEPVFTDAIVETLAHLVGEIDGAHLTGVGVGNGSGAVAAVGAGYLVTGTITEHDGELLAALDLTTAAGAHVATIQTRKPSTQMAGLLDAVADQIGRAINPAAKLAPGPNPLRARTFMKVGMPLLQSGRFAEARPFLEQAVDADPTLFDGWYGLVMILSWMEASEDLIGSSIERALEHAPVGPRKELLRGVQLYLQGDFAAARGLLEPLEHTIDPASPDRAALLYYLGETNWHDGRHTAGFGYFKRTLETNSNFRAASVHAWEYNVARRKDEAARYYIGLANESQEWADLALGHYAKVATGGTRAFKMWAQLILDRGLTPDVKAQLDSDDTDSILLRIARAAGANDTKTASAEFRTLWSRVIAARDGGQLSPGWFYSIESLAEVVLTAGMTEESREVVEFLAEQSHHRPARGYQRFSILAAGLLHDPALVVPATTERNTRIAAAITAELAKDNAKAASILAELVADPSFFWDYPERAALARNLRALHRRSDLTALCSDTLHPALFRAAMLAFRRICT